MRSNKGVSKNSLWRSKKFLFGAILGAVLLIVVLWWAFGAGRPNNMRTAKVERGDLYQRVTVAGTVEPNKSAPITTPFTGYVQKLFVKVGQKVKANDPIVT